MTNIFIIHGAYGAPEENWFSWLKRELEKLDCKVFVPKFPTPQNQTLQNWLEVLEDYKDHIDENTIFIGHSLGPAFILSILERITSPVKASFFVAGFTGYLDNPDFDTINKTFVDKDFDWKTIRNNCKNFTLLHADNDPYVPLQKAYDLAQHLQVEVNVVPGAGHFNSEAGYTTFTQLLERVKKFL